MPGLDGTGPMGMGPMTGGARGWCNPYGRPFAQWGSGPRFGWGRGRGRGFRRMYWASGVPGWMRSGPMGFWGSPFAAPYTREQEVEYIKEQAAALKEELEALHNRLRDLESEETESE